MSGREGSIGYSFFSDPVIEGRSLNLAPIGEETESEGEPGDPFPGDEDNVGELEFEVVIDTCKL